MDTSESKENLVFDYRTLRGIVGGIAFSFSGVVVVLARTITSSISSSYHTQARDVFVGFLFIIGTLLVAYKGHEHPRTNSDKENFWNTIKNFWRPCRN